MKNINPMFNLEYGLYLLSTRGENKDNMSVINSVMQLSDSPETVALSVNKMNFSNDTVLKTKLFNICPINMDTGFSIFKQFGFVSGRDTDKLQGVCGVSRTKNGLTYLTDVCNSVISCEVITEIDCGTHTLYIAKVTESIAINDKKTMPYSYYHSDVKPQPQQKASSGYICRICGYVYEGEVLPDDFVCPICKHGVADFIKR